MDILTIDYPKLKEKVLSNKMGKNVGIICMKKTLVPWKYEMEVTSHKDPISCEKLKYKPFFLFV
jgi:hypothetical protein